jgi:WD40 repeat protein
VQVDPIKPTLRMPGIKRLELNYGKPLSNFAFKFKLRRYSEEMNFDLLSQGFHSQGVTGVDVCVRKPLVATCSTDKSVRIWQGGQHVYSLEVSSWHTSVVKGQIVGTDFSTWYLRDMMSGSSGHPSQQSQQLARRQ